MPPEPQPISHNRIASLDGLRGLASVLVLTWHFNQAVHSLLPIWTGMDVFFALSGYWITQRLLATRGKPGYLSRFYLNRALRIVPLYYTFLICFLLLIRFCVRTENLPRWEYYLVHWKSFFLFTENWTFIRFGWPADLSLAPTWSVAIETQFYLLWPLVILLLRSAKLRLKVFPILFVLIFLTRLACYFFFPHLRDTLYYNSFFKLDDFLAGSLVCQWQESEKKIDIRLLRWVTIALIAILASVGLISGDATFYNPFFPLIGFSLQAVLAGCLLLLALEPRAHVPLFANGFLQYCGRISYCLYLVHMPILIALSSYFYHFGAGWWPGHYYLFQGLAEITALALSFGISTLSYRYFESYFLRLKR